MKKKLLFLFLILFVACAPSRPLTQTTLATVNPYPPPTATLTVEKRKDTVTPQPTETLTVYPPFLLTIAVEPTLSTVTYHEYDPEDWQVIPGSEHLQYDFYNSVVLDPNHWLWMTDRQNLIYFDGLEWGRVNQDALNYAENQLHLECMDPDGTLWLRGNRPGKKELIRVKNNQINVYPIPNATDEDQLAFTDDQEEGVWIAIKKSSSDHLYHFDGLNWQEIPMPSHYQLGSGFYLVTDAKGYLWLVPNIIGFARYDGKIWHEYKASDYWWKNPDDPMNRSIWIAPGPDRSVWAIKGQVPILSAIYRFYPDGKIEKITQSFMGEHFGSGMKMFIDRQNYLWLIDPLASEPLSTIVFWDGVKWNTFAHLPFNSAETILEQNGKMFFQTDKGWYWYKPKR
jgi:hypothetical protein